MADEPVPSKPARIDFAHTPGTLRDPHQRGRIKTRSKNVSRSEMRGSKASILPIPTSPHCDISQHLWNVANTYWRHGIPPGWMCNTNKPSLFDTAALRQRYKARGCPHSKCIPEMAVATTRSTATATTRTPQGLEAAFAAITLIYLNIWYIISFEFYILHPYLTIQWSLRGCVGAYKSPLYCRS